MCAELEGACQRVLIKEFEAVAAAEAFGRLPAELLIDALRSDLLYVNSEELVFESCVRRARMGNGHGHAWAWAWM